AAAAARNKDSARFIEVSRTIVRTVRGGFAKPEAEAEAEALSLEPGAWSLKPSRLGGRQEPEHRGRVVFLTGPQHGRGKARLVRRIRVVLRLQTEPEAPVVHLAALAVDRAVEEVARVELHARLGGHHLERATRRRIGDTRRLTHRASLTV